MRKKPKEEKCLLCSAIPIGLLRGFKAKVAEKGLKINEVHVALVRYFLDDKLPDDYLKKKT